MRRILFVAVLIALCSPAVHAVPPVIGGCQILPDDNPWNTDISDAPVHPNSKDYIKYINAHGGDFVHPDFGGDTNDWYGIPWQTVTAAQEPMNVSFDYDDESDPGPYPIPDDAMIEGGPDSDGDRHILLVETTNCILYELYYAWPNESGGDIVSWDAGSGAIWDLDSNDLRPEGWTSADAAGLPILPGLANCEQAEAGEIDHALRFTVSSTQRAFVYPATHYASSNRDPDAPPMGLRLRLKAGYDTSFLEGQALAIANALKTYGMILADNGSNWFISGEYNPDCWDDDELNDLKQIPGKAFEVIVSPPPPSDVEGDLLLNGDFEAGEPNGKKPSYWKASLTKDRRTCSTTVEINGVDHDVAHNGRCAFAFKGSGGGPSDSIVQTVSVGGLSMSSLRVRYHAAAAGAASDDRRAWVKIKAIYADKSDNFATIVDLPAGSSGYMSADTELTGPQLDGLVRIKIKFIYKGKSGSVWIDNVSVVAFNAPRALPLPPPAG